MFVGVAVGFGAIVGLLAIGTSISKMQVTAGSPTCTGTDVSGRSGAIELRPGMTCTVPVTVRNPGPLVVHLDEAVLPFMGPAGGAAVQVRSWQGRVPEGAATDAVFDLDRRLEPGDTWETEVQLRFRPDGCTARGTHSSYLLEVRANAWGRSVRVAGAGVLFDGTAESEC